MTIPAYPLQWPNGWKRTRPDWRTTARFGRASRSTGAGWQHGRALTIAEGVERVRAELARMRIDDGDLVISTNLVLRLDGLPRSDQREPDDPGAAVYWRDGTDRAAAPRCMAIDRYDRVADNLAAIAATLDAMRAIERHGGAEILQRAFTGFLALEHGGADHWTVVFDVPATASPDAVRTAYHRARSKAHPDAASGSVERFARVQAAWVAYQAGAAP